jgi:hypothetical protein
VSSGLAAGQSFEFPKAPEPEPSWLESLWSLPVFKWLAGLDATPIPPPRLAIAAPALPPCSVQPLAAIEDPTAIDMESASTLNRDGLTPRASRALTRFENIVEARGGSFTLTSAYRPSTYQAHLRDVWFKWMYELRNNQDPSCLELKAQVGNEFTRHGLLATQHPVEVSDHTLGIGFDAAILLPAGKRRRGRVSLDRLARLAGVSRPDIRRDPVHFRVIGGRG